MGLFRLPTGFFAKKTAYLHFEAEVSSFKFQVSSFICHIHDYTETV